MSMQKAEPCNRCGGDPILQKITDTENNITFWIECSNNRAHRSIPGETEQDVIARWNRNFGAISARVYKQYRSVTGCIFRTAKSHEHGGYGIFLKFCGDNDWQQQVTLFKPSYKTQDDAQGDLDKAAIRAGWEEAE